MLRLDLLAHSRTRLFWALHAAGWGAYATAQHLGALLYREPLGYHLVIAMAAASGFVISVPLRYVYRRWWQAGPRLLALVALGTCWLLALPWRAIINNAYRALVETDWQFRSIYEVFSGTLSSTYLLLCWSGMYFGIKYYEVLRQQREAALSAAALAQAAQLKMLRYQLNPHFLFNTLNAISTLILDNKDQTAVQTINRLSDFLRYTLDQDPMKKVTLRQELEALNLYLSTERLRFGSRLVLEFEVGEEAMDARIPSLLLQPLIENAIKYAVTPREQGGRIKVEGRISEQRLQLAVVDDGPGMAAAPPQPGERGVGLRNTRERLAVLYGAAQHLRVTDAAPGLRVELSLPFERSAA